jgi:hypothetical protein
MAEMNVRNLSLEPRLEVVFGKAARQLPGDIGDELLTFVSPGSLATMAAILVAWAGSHFFGVGEVADIVLLIVGYVALGGVAVEAGKHIFDFTKLTMNANSERDLDEAAKHLAKAIALIGVQVILGLLLRKAPKDLFKVPRNRKLPPFKGAFATALPRNAPLRFRPKLTFTKKLNFGNGGTNAVGDIRVGTGARFGNMKKEELLATLYHEKVHQFMTPKMYFLRNIRIYAKQSGYVRSYILRYLEEAIAETFGLLRAYGMSAQNIIRGLKFPIENTGYQITYAALGNEATGILLGPVIAGGMVYNVYYGFVDNI